MTALLTSCLGCPSRRKQVVHQWLSPVPVAPQFYRLLDSSGFSLPRACDLWFGLDLFSLCSFFLVHCTSLYTHFNTENTTDVTDLHTLYEHWLTCFLLHKSLVKSHVLSSPLCPPLEPGFDKVGSHLYLALCGSQIKICI